MNRIEKLAGILTELYRSPDPETVYAYSPGICILPSGRLIATMDQGGPGVKNLSGIKGIIGKIEVQGKIYLSDDEGETWRHVTDTPMQHARPFVAGDSVYVLGHAGDLVIVRSDDGGETWSEPVYLTQGQSWHQAPCNVHYAKGNVYLVMERKLDYVCKTWPVSILAPILMRASCKDDLTKVQSWTFASEICCKETVDLTKSKYFGMPFYKALDGVTNVLAENPKRHFPPPGWLETNVVQFTDPRHIWYDPEGKTFHLWMRAHTGWTNMAAILKVVENDDGTMTTMTESAPSGEPLVYVPCPGGEMKFHILWDEMSKRFWMISTQPTDSMTRPELLEEDRYDLPNNERQRLVLYFSRNCVDWCFAGLVDQGDSQKQSRHYASMAISGENLIILSRSGDQDSFNAHCTNMITVHKIHDFRNLIY
ncbi:MAG: exo-alpha-sialidase [Clostridia bacterium]|nr:exo-alpha-sialidase [Clostridia bacterium]